MSLSVRRFEQRDADRVRELHVAAMREFDAFSPDDSLDADLRDVETAYLDGAGGGGGGEFFVGERDGRVVAMGAFRPAEGYITAFVDGLGDQPAEVKRMRVDPDHQRSGFGQRIYDELEARARDRGFTEFVLDTTPEQTAARRFYEANGFEEGARETVEPAGTAFELVCYRKRLE